MSADNGVYVLSTISKWKRNNGVWERREMPVKVYRVAHTSAIDNFDWYKQEQLYNLGHYMFQTWGKSPVYETEEEALLAAHAMAKGIEILEYGVSCIDTEYIFPGELS